MYTKLFPIIATTDVARSVEFYRGLLGGTVTYEFPGPNGSPAYVGLTVGDSSLGIGLTDAPVVVPRPRPIALWVYADDCDAAVADLRAAGVPVIEEPTTQPWGERVARVLDPDGNEVIIGAIVTADEE